MTNTKDRYTGTLDQNNFAVDWVPSFTHDKEFLKAKIDFFKNNENKSMKYMLTEYDIFIESFTKSLQNNKQIEIIGLDSFNQKDVVVGCQHFLDQLIMTHGLDKLQVFEGGYGYYKRLDPKFKHVTLESLQAQKPLIIEYPFPRTGDVHPQYDEIINTANKLEIPVYLDCAWLPISWDIKLDLTPPCIKGMAISLSKCFGLAWSRVGVRWMKDTVTDTISIENHYRMVSYPSIMLGKYYMDRFPMEHLINKYKKLYFELCREHDLKPGKTIMTAFSKVDNRMIGVAQALVNKIKK